MESRMRHLVRLEEKTLEFVFHILQLQFNKSGKFYLQVSVTNFHRKDLLPQVLLEVDDSGFYEPRHLIKTDSVTWDENSTRAVFNRSKFKFILPKGFCKNDGNHDVYLLIEVFGTTPTNRSKKPEMMGEAKFAIYPRTEMPRANLFAKKGDDYYNYSGVLTLLRPLTRASISMHCGRLTYAVAFHEYIDPEEVIADESDEDEETVLTPVTEEPRSDLQYLQDGNLNNTPASHAIYNVSNMTSEIQKESPRKEIMSSTDFSPERFSHEPYTVLEKAKSIDRTTQWTPQDLTPMPEPYAEEEEGNFHLSISSSPSLEDPNHPTNRERTMDSPSLINQSPSTSKITNKQVGRSTRHQAKSPTMTSPVPTVEAMLSKPNHHVASPGFEEIYVLMHGATSLPSRSDGQDPLPFATLKSLADENGARKAQAATHATIQATHSPSWEEILLMKVTEDTAEEEEVILTVADSVTKEKLVTFRISLKNLNPFHHYHFDLNRPTKSITSGIHVFATVQRRSGYLPRLQNFGYCGLEVLLRDFNRKLKNAAVPLLAVARIVPDYTIYKERMLSKKASGITTTMVTFPSPHPSAFEIPYEQLQGYPQVTTASEGAYNPCWNHVFLFCANDTATMFTHNSALVIEYYPSTSSMSAISWTVRSPIGFSTILLDDDVFQALISDAGRLGVRLDDLLIQGSQFETESGASPSVNLILRLIHTERPDTLATAAMPSLLPSLDSMPNPGTKFNGQSPRANNYQSPRNGQLEEVVTPPEQPVKLNPVFESQKTKVDELMNEDAYPPSDILETILPEYVLTENDNYLPQTSRRIPDQTKVMQHTDGVEDNQTMALVNHQAKELQNYREAVKRMATDIVALRDDVTRLQSENANLRRELLLKQEMGDMVMRDFDTGALSADEVADKFVSVKQKLSKESEELKKYRMKVQHLQNLLIKANDREKHFLIESKSSKSKQEEVAQLREKMKKMKKLEETCVQQEKVIEKMEKVLDKKVNADYNYTAPQRHRNYQGQENTPQQVSSILAEENARLRSEIQTLRLQEQTMKAEQAQLEMKLERSEGRVSSLESQLEQNSRRWAKERHELSIRLQEHRNGFTRSKVNEFSHPDSLLLYEDSSSDANSFYSWRR